MLMQVETAPAAPELLLDRNVFLRTDRVVTDRPATITDEKVIDRVVLERGPNMMVLFRGRPREAEVAALRQEGVTIGLALSPAELSSVPSLDAYDYVCISMHWRDRSILAEAVTDLKRGGWTIDDTPV